MTLTVAVGVVGPGLIGGALLRQMARQVPSLLSQLNVAAIQVVGVANSQRMLLAPGGLDLATWRSDLVSEQARPLDLQAFVDTVLGSARGAPNADGAHRCCVLVDCTASEALPSMYFRLARAGLHIITPNKKFGAGPLERYQQLMEVCRTTGRRFMYEATVGAGLPVVSTLQGLLDTGDRVRRVQGILSGTLSYIFNTYKAGMSFSSVVAEAKAKGYTEPDPRDDLSGADVARKVVILARECGLAVEAEYMHVDSLVPRELEGGDVSVHQFMERLPQYDGAMATRAQEAATRGEVVRYVGTVDVEAGTASVELSSYPASHPFAQLSGSDNIVVFSTERYSETPLVVRGPGAGAEVTAGGVFADLLQVIRTHRR